MGVTPPMREVTEPIRCCNQSPKLIPVWTEHAISFIVSCIWTLDPQLVLLFGKALVTWKGRASLEVLGHCGEALEGFYFNPTSRLFYASCQQIRRDQSGFQFLASYLPHDDGLKL